MSSEPRRSDSTHDDAARTIQRNYRGYRSRRQLHGLSLDASTRWVEAVREAQYRNLTQPRPRTEYPEHRLSANPTSTLRNYSEPAHLRWKTARKIVGRAVEDDTSDTDGDDTMSPVAKEEYRLKKREAKKHNEELAKTMGLEYFLEMVDQNHRYGSQLRKYHALWQNAETSENFFYWLDHGEGKQLNHPECSRDKLDKNRVRYLSREERLHYLVEIDDKGRLQWAKNGLRVTTGKDYNDSMEGIVSLQDLDKSARTKLDSPKLEEGSLSSSEDDEAEDLDRGPTRGTNFRPPLDTSTSFPSPKPEHHVGDKIPSQSHTVPAAAFLQHLISHPSKKKIWIFVSDTSGRLYIGLKQSGAFQHSSFLHGARVFAAGQIHVKDGQIHRLHPLSGHYRPPKANFRAFLEALRSNGADLSRVSIPESYIVLVGTSGYNKAKKEFGQKIKEIRHGVERLLSPMDDHHKN